MKQASARREPAIAIAALVAAAAAGILLPQAGAAVAAALVVVFSAARLARLYRVPAGRAWAGAGVVCAAAWLIGAALGAPIASLGAVAGLVLVAAWITAWAVHPGSPAAVATRRGVAGITAAILGGSALAGAGALRATAVDHTPQAERTTDFVPLAIDAGGKRLLLFSIRDSDTGPDEDTFSYWSLDVSSGQARRMYRGYPYLTVDWCPSGNQATFCAGDGPLDGTAPLSLYAAGHDGTNVRRRLAAPATGGSFVYPLWSKRDDLLGVWLIDGNPALPLAGPSQAVPKSYAVPASQGNAVELQVRGTRLSLMSAWQADGTGAYMVTENGLHLLDAKSGKSRRLVAAGEAPLDPFPFITPEGVSPAGGNVAYIEVTFKKGDFDHIDLGLTTDHGGSRGVARDIIPMAFDWSADGKLLVSAQAHGKRLMITALDVSSKRLRKIVTEQPVGVKQPVAQLLVSRDGRYACVDGLLESEDAWSLGIWDLETGKRVVDLKNVALACGWSADNRLLAADLKHVGAIDPATGKITPVYPKTASFAFQEATPQGLAAALAVRQRESRARLHAAVALVSSSR